VRFPYVAWVAWIERHHRLVVALSLVLCVLSALALTRLRLDIDVLSMLPQGEPAFDDFKAFVADFGELDQLIVLIEGRSEEGLHTFADDFAQRLGALETVAAVQSRIDVQQLMDGLMGQYVYNYVPAADYAELEGRLTPAGIDAQIAADRAILGAPFDLSATRTVADDPLGVRRLAAGALADAYGGLAPNLRDGYLSAADGTAVLLLVRPRASAFDIAFSRRLLQQVQAAEAETRAATADADVRVSYTGSYVYALEDAATLHWDITRYTLLALVGVLAVFYVGYRNLRILPFVTYPLVVTTLLTFALSLLLFDQLNAVSISFAAILYGLAIDSGIYFYSRLQQERAYADVRGAVTATLAGLGVANLAASTTTAAAFFVIGFSCLSAVRQLGFLTALGMLLTTVEFFTLFPALSFLLGRAIPVRAAALDTPRLARVAGGAATRATGVGLTSVVLGIGLLVAARGVSLDVGLTHLRPRASHAAQVQDLIAARFDQRSSGGAILVTHTDLEQALIDNEAIAQRLAAYRGEGLLQSVQSVAPLLPSARTQAVRLALYNRLPRTAAVEEIRTALARHGFAPQRFAAFLTTFTQPRTDVVHLGDPVLEPLAFLIHQHVRKGTGGYNVATYVTPASGVSLRTVAERLQRDLPDVRCTVAARSLLEEELGVVLRRELRVCFVLGLLGNFLLLLLSFGSAGTAIAILAPVVLVIIALFAGMWLTGIALDPVNLIVTPLLFGVGVDYGVYLVARARERAAVDQAVRYAGKAVVVTACTTITGFGFLGLSRFPALATMGLLAGVGLLLCLALSIVLLPALLTLLGREWRTQPE